jgi:hypothetical protein
MMQTSRLPLKRDLSTCSKLSLLIALLMTTASLLGILFPSYFYPSKEAIESFLTNDVINLVIGLPALLGSIWLTRRESLIGLFFWPGALIYVLYNYIAVLLGAPLSPISLLYGALIVSCAIACILWVQSIDQDIVKDQLTGLVREWLAAIVLLLFGVGFLLLAVSILAGAMSNPASIPAADLSVSIADLVVSWLWILGGYWLIRKLSLGYATGLGLLFAALTLISGLILLLLLRPLLTTGTFNPNEIVPILVFWIVCVVPFGFFVRGVIQAERVT